MQISQQLFKEFYPILPDKRHDFKNPFISPEVLNQGQKNPLHMNKYSIENQFHN